jgi:hypothetical protein
MSNRLELVLVFVLAAAVPAIAQHPEEGQHGHGPQKSEARHTDPPRANQGKIPPAPDRREGHATAEEQRHENGKVNGWQHVDHDHWYGHDEPEDKRYHFEHPYQHGHFARFGPSYRYNIVRIDRDHHRFWLPSGFYFEVAPWDWSVCSDWCWNCGNDFVVYEDPDHVGWYLLYNVHTGVYVHVSYLGT